jgi:hypothetical protein
MMAPLRERCQFENTIYCYVFPFGQARAIRRALRRALERFAARAPEGKPSRYAAGDAVRVKDAAAIQATLDGRGMLRGLAFTPEQWAYCGRTFQVERQVLRMMNDAGLMRAIGRTVALVGVTCDGVERTGGCGRACPLLFREEWLESSPSELAAPLQNRGYARVKPLAEILRTLDSDGRRDGVMFSPAMARYAGARFPVHKRVQPVAATWWRRPGAAWYIFEGLRCLGEPLGGDGPCHRGCGLLWHESWLELED